MPNRYWVGGTASWDGTAGTKWAATSGGAGGASVPTSADDVFFDAASGAVTVTIAASANCLNLNCTGFTGTITGTSTINVYANTTLASGMTWSHAGNFVFQATSGSYTVTSAGKTFGAGLIFGLLSSSTATWTLQDALVAVSNITHTSGTFNTNNYAVTATSLVSSNTNTRTINLGSSTVTLTSGSSWFCATATNLTLNAGTSTLVFQSSVPAIIHGSNDGVTGTFNNVSFTSTSISTASIRGSLVFNNLTIAGRTSAGVSIVQVSSGTGGNGNPTINGTLTLSAGTNATMRTFVQSDVIGTQRTLTCNAVAALTDIDFRDIRIAGSALGAAGNVSGTRLGDCKGNSGITFPAPKTVWWSLFAGGNWSSTAWTIQGAGGNPFVTDFPLAQDTAIIVNTNLTSPETITLDASYNIGTVNMGSRTNAATLATGSTTPVIYGNWINGTGTTLTGTGALTFAGRGSQTITSAGKTFTQPVTINTPSGSVTLQDAFVSNSGVTLQAGTFSLNGYNAINTNATFSLASTKTVDIGSATWTLTTSGTVWNYAGSNLTVTGTGTISLTSATGKTFAGGGIQTYPTLNQGGAGTLTITGSNKFANITDTAIGRVQFTGGTTNIFDAFNLGGTAGNLLQLGSTNTTQATLQKSSAWLMGANSTNGGNNTGLSFTAGGGIDYLSVSYIRGTVVSSGVTNIYYGTDNTLNLYYGSTPVTSVYYGSTKVWG